MKNLNKYYKTISKRFDTVRLDLNSEIKDHCRWFVNNRILNNKKLLDIGCGTGRYTFEFASYGITVLGIDNSPQQIEEAIKKIPCHVSNALNLPYKKNSFDIVSMIMMIQQIPNEQLSLLLNQISHIIKPNGLLWIKSCSHDDLNNRPFDDYFPSAYKINTNRYPKISALKENLGNLSFTCARSIVKSNKFKLSGFDLISRFSMKHNSTLFLIPDNEFSTGLEQMKEKYSNNNEYEFTNYHTLLEFKKTI